MRHIHVNKPEPKQPNPHDCTYDITGLTRDEVEILRVLIGLSCTGDRVPSLYSLWEGLAEAVRASDPANYYIKHKLRVDAGKSFYDAIELDHK